MDFFSDLNQWLLVEWIWNVTWGFYHVPIVVLSMVCILRWYMRYSYSKALFLSLMSALCAIGVYTLYVPVILISVVGLTTDWVADPLPASLYLAIIYTFLQSCFVWFWNIWRPIDMQRVIIAIAVSNVIAALIVCKYALTGLLI